MITKVEFPILSQAVLKVQILGIGTAPESYAIQPQMFTNPWGEMWYTHGKRWLSRSDIDSYHQLSLAIISYHSSPLSLRIM